MHDRSDNAGHTAKGGLPHIARILINYSRLASSTITRVKL